MWAPAISSLILAKAVERTSWRTRVGLRFRGRWLRILAWTPAAFDLVAAAIVLGFVVSALRGVPMDLTGRTWLQIMTARTAAESGQDVPVNVLVLVVAMMAVAGLLVTFLSTLGEEIGRRGWLWPALTPLGRVPAALLGGVIWSLWHLPMVLIGHNCPGESRPVAVAMFLLPCIAMTLQFGAITDRAAGSPIPAALAHAAINPLPGTALMVVATTQTTEHYSMLVDGPLGLIGSVLMVVIGLALLIRRRDPELPRLDPLDPVDRPGSPHATG